MTTIKQIQSRIQNKKSSLDKVNNNIAQATSSKNMIVLRRLNQEKGSLDRDIRNLQRQLVTMESASRN